jgi:hypothetical protein
MPSSTSKSSTDAAVLVDPKRDVPRGERDIRLEDYLNDKIQTMADLANLSKIIETVEIMLPEFWIKLQDSKSNIRASKTAL